MKETLMGVLVTLTLATPAQAEKAEDSIECLAQNIYFEARSQSLAGQMAVGLVTRNRVLDKRFPNSFCELTKRFFLSHCLIKLSFCQPASFSCSS